MDQTSSNSTLLFENSVDVPKRQFFNVFIVPQKECGARFGVISHGTSIKKKLGIIGDESCNVYLPHRTQYAIGILNISTYPAEASVKIDGKFIGLFYLDGYKYIEISNGPHMKTRVLYSQVFVKTRPMPILPVKI